MFSVREQLVTNVCLNNNITSATISAVTIFKIDSEIVNSSRIKCRIEWAILHNQMVDFHILSAVMRSMTSISVKELVELNDVLFDAFCDRCCVVTSKSYLLAHLLTTCLSVCHQQAIF